MELMPYRIKTIIGISNAIRTSVETATISCYPKSAPDCDTIQQMKGVIVKDHGTTIREIGNVCVLRGGGD